MELAKKDLLRKKDSQILNLKQKLREFLEDGTLGKDEKI